jgi:hypothetical protein
MDQSSSFSLLIEEPVVISKLRPSSVRGNPSSLNKDSLCCRPRKRCGYESVDGFAWRLSCVNFVNFSVGVAFRFQLRGTGIEVVWKPFLILLVIGSILFCLALARFRKTIGQMA